MDEKAVERKRRRGKLADAEAEAEELGQRSWGRGAGAGCLVTQTVSTRHMLMHAWTLLYTLHLDFVLAHVRADAAQAFCRSKVQAAI